MNRRKLLWTVAVVLVAIALVGLWTVYGTHTVTLSEAKIQAQVNKVIGQEFPVSGKAKLVLKSSTIRSADVRVTNGTLSAFIVVDGALRLNKKFTLTTHATGVPEYSSGAFYFRPTEVEVERFAYEGSTPTELLTKLAKRYVSNEKASQLIQDAAPKVEEWMTTTAENAAVRTLQHKPVYELKGDIKGVLIRASLDSVKVEANTIKLTFTLWRLTVSVFIGLFCLVAAIGLIVLLVKHPELGAALEVVGAVADVVGIIKG